MKSKLPTLPCILKKKEALWTTTVFIPWCKQYGRTFAWEVKHTRGKDYLNFNEVKPHQIENLLNARHKVHVYKNPDMGEKTPFDGQCLASVPAYIVIKYKKDWVMITVDAFVLESKKSKRRSLTWSRAVDIAFKVIHNSVCK